MVTGKPKDQNYYQGELGGQLGDMCMIKIMQSILGITPHVVNSCNYISALRQAKIHPEAVKSRWKQVDLISRLSDVYQSMYSSMSLVHIYGHHNSGIPSSTLTALASINVRIDALLERIMAGFILSPATRNKIAIGLSDPHRISRVSIHGSPFHYNITQSISLEIFKIQALQHWDYHNLTHKEYLDEIDLT